MKEPLLKVNPGEKVIILDEVEEIIYSDFMPDQLCGEAHLKLSDVLGEHNKDLMGMLDEARRPDTRQVAGTLPLKGMWWDIRILHVERIGAEPARTHIYFSAFKTPKVYGPKTAEDGK